MDIEKLIEQLNGYFEGKDLKRFVALDAATALSTLQAENEKLRAELENYRKGHCSEGGCAAEKDRDAVLAELEQVKRVWPGCKMCKTPSIAPPMALEELRKKLEALNNDKK